MLDQGEPMDRIDGAAPGIRTRLQCWTRNYVRTYVRTQCGHPATAAAADTSAAAASIRTCYVRVLCLVLLLVLLLRTVAATYVRTYVLTPLLARQLMQPTMCSLTGQASDATSHVFIGWPGGQCKQPASVCHFAGKGAREGLRVYVRTPVSRKCGTPVPGPDLEEQPAAAEQARL